MSPNSYRFINLPVAGLLALSAVCFGAGSASAQEVTDINEFEKQERLTNQLRELEFELGRQNPALMEPLLSLVDSSSALGLHYEASTLLDRAIQIRRINDGLTTAAQIPLYFSKIEIDMHRQDWDAVNQSLDYLYWLTVEKAAVTDDSVIDHLLQLGEFHLRAVATDDPAQRARHFREAAEFVYISLDVSARLWGRNDNRRLDILYNLIKQFHLQSVALELKDDTAYELRAIVPGSTWVRPKSVVQNNYYRAGLRLFDEMAAIVSSADNAEESLAMVSLYRADWHLLFNQIEAREAYSNSFSDFLAAGLNRDRINDLFSEPRVLPLPQFHATLANAEAGMRQATKPREIPPAVTETANNTSTIAFREWYRDMPAVAYPSLSRNLAADPIGNGIWLRFELGPLTSVSRWINGTYRSGLSVMEAFDILDSEVSEEADLSQLNDRLHFLHLRPRLVDGKAQPVEGTMLYQVAAQ